VFSNSSVEHWGCLDAIKVSGAVIQQFTAIAFRERAIPSQLACFTLHKAHGTSTPLPLHFLRRARPTLEHLGLNAVVIRSCRA
jgi:hypothetical protein